MRVTTKALGISVIFALLAISATHAWNEPDSFMGIKFFADLTKSLKECKKERGSYKYFDSSQGVCWQQESDFHYRIRYTDLFTEVHAYTVDRKLAYLDCDFHWEMYPRTAAIFRERYGQPTAVNYETLTNARGAKIRNEVLSWNGTKIWISIRQHTTVLDRGQATYDTQLWRDFAARKSQQDIKKAAKGL